MIRSLSLKDFFLTFFLLFSLTSFSQEIFKHAENLAGFGNVKNNNGVSVADYDGDLDLDVFVVSIERDNNGDPSTLSKLFRNNNNGTFTDVTEESGIKNLLFPNELNSSYLYFVGLEGVKFGAFWGDYDNDGYPDIFFTHLSKVQLFKNNGNGTFSDVTDQAGIKGKNECENTGATWFDYDNDGFLDIYIGDWRKCANNTFYKNNGNGTFTDVTISANMQTVSSFASYTPMPYDFNNDGWMDLYVSNDIKQPNTLFINNNGTTFSENANAYGLNTAEDDMGIAVADYNKDGLFDFFITAIDKNFLLTNKGNGTFEDTSVINGVDNSAWAWGTKFADFDLDGDEDLVVANGYIINNRTAERNIYYENTYGEGGNSFSNTNNQGIGEVTVSVEALDFDYDHDGDLDLFITNSNDVSFFYENTINSAANNSGLKWLQVSLEGTVSNRNAIGTTLTLTTDLGEYKRYYTGVGFLGQSLKPVHFGLKNSTKIIELKIEWPSGYVDVHTNIELNSFIKATEDKGFENLNLTPAEKVLGCTDPNACNYNPNAATENGSCVYLNVGNAEIEGSKISSYFSVETYTYPLQSGSNINWKVEGGEIINKSASNSIDVKWGFEQRGLVTATVNDNQCNSEEISLDVELTLSNLPDNISLARIWNEALLDAIRNDFARPTIHARNLFHTSIAMYDTWAIFSEEAKTYLIGNTVNGFKSEFNTFKTSENKEEAKRKAMSYAVYRLLSYRFKDSPNAEETQQKLDLLMYQLKYNIFDTNTNYEESGDGAALGNFIAQTIIEYGKVDGSRESSGYDNAFYTPVNSPLAPHLSGNPDVTDPNRWQSLNLEVFIDQSGNLISEGVPIDFLSPEWGSVYGFALNEKDKSRKQRDGNTFLVYHDPLDPPYLDLNNPQNSEDYKWGFSLVSIWGSHLDPSDGVLWDISPKSLGNIDSSIFPDSFSDFSSFYNLLEGGDIGNGYTNNPKTGAPYDSQIVPRGDYARVLAEFWADGPDSETPPGHWFTILNYINDNESLEKKLEGVGEVLDPLEWDVKAYFTLGGAMHDAAISAWSVKGWYDYIRPISAIRYMAELGQSSDTTKPNYHPNGIPLQQNFVELVSENDPLAGRDNENVGKIKLYTWKGHRFINNTQIDQAGVGWILAENWWPYQRPSFVTPPFAGYVSGHSTYSRAAAEVLTAFTGDEFFPGGMGEFVAKKNEFLVFEQGPSQDVKLQWATYRDASDQCSLSRIWGGIHPPADDIPGRKIGEVVGKEAFSYAKSYFTGKERSFLISDEATIYPNPVNSNGILSVENTEENDIFHLFNMSGQKINIEQQYNASRKNTIVKLGKVNTGVYVLSNGKGKTWKVVIL